MQLDVDGAIASTAHSGSRVRLVAAAHHSRNPPPPPPRPHSLSLPHLLLLLLLLDCVHRTRLIVERGEALHCRHLHLPLRCPIGERCYVCSTQRSSRVEEAR